MALRPLGIKCKLIAIFIVIKVVPLILLAWIAWNGIKYLGEMLQDKVARLSNETQEIIGQVSNLAVDSSIRALDLKSRENIERLTTDTARTVAAFLYDRDNDIRRAGELEPTEENYRRFLKPLRRVVIMHKPWRMNQDGDAWVPVAGAPPPEAEIVARNKDNAKDFHYRPPDMIGIPEERPLYLEMTFVDLQGREQVKVTTSDLLPPEKRDISNKENTFCKAERYFSELKALAPCEIYVSEVVGPYVGSPVIGAFTRKRAEEMGIPFTPEEAAYAGKENPVGKRFQGIIRWATPVERRGEIIGWVTLALDHTHVMEFTDHIVPTDERYSAISDAGSGNYAFMWDYKDRNISHPRDFFITGYAPETGQPAVPWLEEGMYENFKQSGLSLTQWEKTAPVLQDQSLEKRPALALTRAGLLGLDCRYLNFAPQCDGWNHLTSNGGSGSFVIFWSGLWKLTTAAAIPYHTGIYSGPRGFGFITIGANVHEFHRAANETGAKISKMVDDYVLSLEAQSREAQENLEFHLNKTTKEISLSTLVMVVLVIFIAIWMASWLTRKITNIIKGIRLFQAGEMSHRLHVGSSDEIGMLSKTFNHMADDIQSLISNLQQAEEKYRSFFENSTEGIFRTTLDGRIVAVNAAYAKLFGYNSPDAMMADITDLGKQAYADPERREELIRLLNEKGAVTDFEHEIVLPDGSKRYVRVSCKWTTDVDGTRYLEGVCTDVTEHTLATMALQEAKDKAEQLSDLKSNFLSMVSHELRTPLTAIRGFAKMTRKSVEKIMETHPVNTDEESKFLQRINENNEVIVAEGERLTELINNVLDIAKLEAGHFEWHKQDVFLLEVLEHSIAATNVLFDKKGLELRKVFAKDLPVISGDKDRLVQVCINLLANAAKFTEKGHVLCQAMVENQSAVIRVIDTGCGVPPSEVETIFDKFRQLGDTLTDKPKGTGLGLAISKEIVEHHGGRIWCEPVEGGGSMFAFTIPLRQQ